MNFEAQYFSPLTKKTYFRLYECLYNAELWLSSKNGKYKQIRAKAKIPGAK